MKSATARTHDEMVLQSPNYYSDPGSLVRYCRSTSLYSNIPEQSSESSMTLRDMFGKNTGSLGVRRKRTVGFEAKERNRLGVSSMVHKVADVDAHCSKRLRTD
jgi:hypothetical protein